MKKIILCILLSAVIGGYAYQKVNSDINAEEILAQSQLKNRQFKAEVKEITADDGKIKAYVMEEHSLPLVAMSFGFAKSGQAYENKEGTGLLIDSVLLDGTKQHTRQELRDFMKEKGIKVGVSVSADRMDFSLSYVKQFEQEATEILKEILYEPLFADSDLDLARRQLAVARQQQLENPQYYLGKLIDKHFYKEHPYGRDNIPEEEKLKAISGDDIRAYMKDSMTKDRLAIGIAGDITEAEAVALMEKVFKGLQDSGDERELPKLEADFTEEKQVDTLDFSKQSFVYMMGKGIKRLDDDFYPLYLADYIFGGSGLNSRLNKAVREKEGLTYGIYSYFSNTDAINLWQIAFSATPENAAKAIEVADGEYRRFYNEGVSAEELNLAKESLLSAFNLRFASLFNIAEMLRIMMVEKLGVDFLEKRQDMVRAVTLEAVNDAIKRKMPKQLNGKGGVRVFEVMGSKG